ncbi:MAG: AAA family ATPase [Candidatus Omnitrophota bacterium]
MSMYFDFYGLNTPPFNITSDPQFFFEGSSHKEALAVLSYGIQEKKGIILVTGEVGTGKTTLCRMLLGRLPAQVKTSLILNPYFSDVQLLQAIVEDFGLNPQKRSRLELVKKLNAFLLEVSVAGGNAVLIIDEAQDLNARQLEQVRLLSNLETATSKLLQIVLVGQPELGEKLHKFNLRQIYQRILVKHNLYPLNESEVKDYIQFRLSRAGSPGITILPESFKLIYEFSKGTPRLINVLCDRALLCGFVREKRVFDEEIFKACIEELK